MKEAEVSSITEAVFFM